MLAVVSLYILVEENATTLQFIPGDQIVEQIGLAGVAFVAIVVIVLALPMRAGAYAAVGLVILELVVLAPNPFAERRDPYVAPAWMQVLGAELASRPTDRIFGLDGMLYPNIAAAYGLYDIRMVDAMYIDRYYRYIRTFITPGIYDRFIGEHIGSNEGISAYRHNQMFDLLGVRYIVSRQDANVVLRELLPPGTTTDLLNVRTVTVGGQPRQAIFEHATSETPLSLPSPVIGAVTFDYGVDDVSLTDPTADGVQFSVIATRASGDSEVLWEALYAPGDPLDPDGPGWREGSVDIAASDDPVVELRLRTDARSNTVYDWAAWSAFRFEGMGGELSSKPFEQVAEVDGTLIYENPSAAPRAFVVHDVTVVPDIDAGEAAFEAASDRFGNGALRVNGFDVTERAIVEAESDQIPAALSVGQPGCAVVADEVKITKYESDEVRLQVESACTGLVVLSDTYFPGWQATVNGESAEIHPTDMAFRGVVVGPGRSEVVFRYRPASFRSGVIVAFAAVGTMLAAWIIPVLWRRRSLDSRFVR